MFPPLTNHVSMVVLISLAFWCLHLSLDIVDVNLKRAENLHKFTPYSLMSRKGFKRFRTGWTTTGKLIGKFSKVSFGSIRLDCNFMGS